MGYVFTSPIGGQSPITAFRYIVVDAILGGSPGKRHGRDARSVHAPHGPDAPGGRAALWAPPAAD